MRSLAIVSLVAVTAVAVAGCGGTGVAPRDGGAPGGAASPADAAPVATPADAGLTDGGALFPSCQWGGAPGTCLAAAACAALVDHTAKPSSCPGAPATGCCIDTPDVADNPPPPTGYQPMAQSQVTPAMTTWAVMILHDPVTYPLYASASRTFGALLVLARVEWHPPDFQNAIVHRGVTLYVH